jgi:MFS family permease
MRPRQFWVYMSIYIATLLLMFLINYSGYKTSEMYNTLSELFKSVFYQLLVMQIIVLWIWGTFNSGSAISEEVVDKTYDFFRLLPLTPKAKTIGILVGKNLIVLLVAACNFIFLIAAGIAADLNKMLLAQMMLTLVCGAILINSFTLLSSINPKGRRNKSGVAGFIVLAFILGPVTINGVVSLANKSDVEEVMGLFFGFKLPIMILASIIVLYFSCWTIKGILRKFTYEDEPMFTRKGAYIFMLGYEFVVFGLLNPYLSWVNPSTELDQKGLNFAFWLASSLPVIAIPLGSIRTIDKYLEFAGLLSRTGDKLRLARLTLFSNLSLGIGLFAIWAAVSAATTYLAGLPIVAHLVIIGVIFTFYFLLLLLLELYVVVSPSVNKIGVLLIFIIGIYAILPLILAGIFNIVALAPHSPVGYLGYAASTLDCGQDITTHARVAAVNILLCVIPAILILRRHADVIKARQQM